MDSPITRRNAIAVTGATVIGSLAGCLGGDSGVGTPDTTFGCDISSDTDDQPTVDPASLSRPTLGSDSAAVTVDVFEDFSCSHCRDFALNVFPRLRADYLAVDDSDVRYRHFDAPIPVNDWSRPVANAARAVQDAHGAASFYAYAKRLYENQSEYGWQLVGDLTAELSADVDPCSVLGAGSNQTYTSVIEADKTVASERDIPGTPAVFVDGEMVDSEYGPIADAIDRTLSRPSESPINDSINDQPVIE